MKSASILSCKIKYRPKKIKRSSDERLNFAPATEQRHGKMRRRLYRGDRKQPSTTFGAKILQSSVDVIGVIVQRLLIPTTPNVGPIAVGAPDVVSRLIPSACFSLFVFSEHLDLEPIPAVEAPKPDLVSHMKLQRVRETLSTNSLRLALLKACFHLCWTQKTSAPKRDHSRQLQC